MLEITVIISIALLLDYLFGEPTVAHPLVLYGRWVSWVENKVYPNNNVSNKQCFFWGVCAWFLAVLIPLLLLTLFYFSLPKSFSYIFAILVVYIAIAARSLSEHGRAVAEPLADEDFILAREKLSYLVSRDVDDLDESSIAKATVESMLENTHDAVIAPLMWFVIGGVPGILLFRMANTIDAMWGYRDQRFNYFGRFAARIDNVLGFLSARLTVILFSLVNYKALIIAYRDGRHWYSPNAGPVMAAGAGALSLSLGGNASYSGQYKERPSLGEGNDPTTNDIFRAIKLSKKSYMLFIVVMLLITLFEYIMMS